MTSSPLRIAVIGYGRWGRVCHTALIRMAPGLELAGVASRDSEKRQQIEANLGCRAYQSFEEVLADDTVDAVALATPNSTHCDYAIRALHAGKHVVTDKPMARSLEECDRMVAAARETGKLLTVFQNRRRDGDFLTLKSLIADGTLGDLRWVEVAWQGFGAYGGWRGKAEEGGGRFMDLGPHMVDQLLLLNPSPIKSIYCRMHHDFEGSEVESEAMLILTFANGATAICDTSSLAAISKPRFYARGTNGTFIKYGLDPQEAALMKGDLDSAVEDPEKYGRFANKQGERIIPTLAGRWRDYYENIALAATGVAAPLVPMEESRRLMAVLEMAKRSAREGRVVDGEV